MTQGRRCAGKNSLSIGNQETCLATGCYYFWLLAKILVILVINVALLAFVVFMQHIIEEIANHEAI